jgi:hypothetical protein
LNLNAFSTEVIEAQLATRCSVTMNTTGYTNFDVGLDLPFPERGELFDDIG